MIKADDRYIKLTEDPTCFWRLNIKYQFTIEDVVNIFLKVFPWRRQSSVSCLLLNNRKREQVQAAGDNVLCSEHLVITNQTSFVQQSARSSAVRWQPCLSSQRQMCLKDEQRARAAAAGAYSASSHAQSPHLPLASIPGEAGVDVHLKRLWREATVSMMAQAFYSSREEEEVLVQSGQKYVFL